MSVGILGAGALGQLMAHALQEQGHNVTLLRRPGHADARHSHRLTPLSGPDRCHPISHRASDQPQALSTVLVLTKAQDCLTALEPLLNWLPADVPIVLLHNGMGPQQAAVERWPGHTWWAGSLTDGALAHSSTHVRHTGQGIRKAGPLSDPPTDAALPAPLADAGFEFDNAIVTALWQKLTVNLLINPLTARDRVCNGSLLNEAYRDELRALSEEVALVGRALGQPERGSHILDRALTVAQATAQNRSSMLQDVEAGRPTELDAITGYLIRQADELGLPCPHHRRLYRQLASAQ
ncbi:2-dehydropantoate 2-reductase [Marinobacter hydrocarbonoclasticus]|nr:2-dehydropantoate 2-reductase [Marinobacter nauticus]